MALLAAPTVDFGFHLLEQVDEAAVFSPVSVHTALATVREGAAGDARAALDEVLGTEAPAPLAVDDPAVELALAQAVWADRAVRLAPAFAARAAELGVDCRTLDFADLSAPAEVNTWASEKTHGMIREVIDAFERDEVFALANAAYFDGNWTTPFNPAATRPRPFTLSDGTTKHVPTMHASDKFDYAEDDELQAIWLPYGDTLEIGFVAVIAREGLPRLDAARWTALRSSMRNLEGTVALPSFHAEERFELTDALIALGLGPAFEPGPDFDGLFEGPGDKSLSRVLHRARVELDEQGTRAAAVTVALGRLTSGQLSPPFDLRLDRPFLWAIEHRPSGTLLFMGIVTDPTEGST